MKNRLLKNYLYIFSTLFLVEIVFRLVNSIPVFEWSLLRIVLATNIIALVISMIFSIFGRLVGNIASILISLVGTIYALAQAGFNNYLGTFMSVGTSSQAEAVKDYLIDYLQSFKPTFYLILIPFVIFLGLYIFFEINARHKLKNEKVTFVDKVYGEETKLEELKELKKNRISLFWKTEFCLLVLLVGCCYGFYKTLVSSKMQNELQLKTTKELFFNPDMPNIAVNQFGVIGYGVVDIKTVLFPSLSELGYDTYTKKEQVISDYTRYIDDTAWEELISNTKNNNYKVLNNYYISQEITPKNNYTGLFENKNLIVIMMESTNNIVINEEYFPTMYKLYSEGWTWTNSYSPRNACSTGNNEMSGMTSLYTINSSCTANNYRNNTYPESIFNLFNNKGYTTTSYHNYTDQYYYRETIHPNMGSGKYYGVSSLGIEYSNVYKEWPSDVDLMEKSMEIFLNQDDNNFMVWMDTVSAHQPYTYSCEVCDMYYDDFKDTGYSKEVKRYLSKLKVFDNALKTLLEGLEEAGELNDTVIVLYADHYPYGLGSNNIKSVLGAEMVKGTEIDRTPFVIYNPNLTPTMYDEYTSYINILPTVANLFNLDYDPRLYAGHDLFDENYSNRVIFADGSWRDSIAYYNATTGKISYYEDNAYTADEIKAINKEVSDTIKMSNLAITSNYFEYLFKGLDKYKVVENEEVIVPENNIEVKEEEETTVE